MGMAIADAILNYRNSIPDDASVISNGGGKTVVRDVNAEIKKPETVAKDAETATENEMKKEVVQAIKEAEKTETPKTEEKTDTPKQRMMVSKGGIVFKVQLMASSKDLPLTSAEFKGLNKISKEPVNKLFRYLYGDTDTYTGAKLLKANADQKGFTSSYIVAYKEGKRIPLEDALKYEED
jgi:N-acetylmuramoyl-L-alanine amidase